MAAIGASGLAHRYLYCAELSRGSTKAQPASNAATLQRCEESDPRMRPERRAIVLISPAICTPPLTTHPAFNMLFTTHVSSALSGAPQNETSGRKSASAWTRLHWQ